MPPLPSPRRRLGSTRARRFSKPSAVTRPAATSSHNASSTSLASRPVARARSAKNDAPRLLSSASTSRAGCDSEASGAGWRRGQQPVRVLAQEIWPAARRAWAARDARVPSSSRSKAGCGESRPQITSPERQSSSRYSGCSAPRAGQDLGFPRRGGNLAVPATAG